MATVMASPPAAAAPPAPNRSSRAQRDRSIFIVAVAIAALLHLVLFLTVSFELDPAPVRAPHVAVRSFRVDPRVQTYDIDVVQAPDVPVVLPPRVETPPVPVQPAPLQAPLVPAPAGEVVAPAPDAAAERARGALERLSRGYGNPQLFGEAPPLPLEELTEKDLLRLRLEVLLGMYNDSLAAEAAARTRATDWTTRDASGNRWGISPGKIHLGKITLPLPFGFSAPPGRREEVAAKVRSWYETQSQASRLEAEETFEQRVKAIRERQKAQRDSTKRGGGG